MAQNLIAGGRPLVYVSSFTQRFMHGPLARGGSCMPQLAFQPQAEPSWQDVRGSFSEDPLENVLSGLAWEHILYQDGPVGGELSSSPAIS